jgi:hypothetical protein
MSPTLTVGGHLKTDDRGMMDQAQPAGTNVVLTGKRRQTEQYTFHHHVAFPETENNGKVTLSSFLQGPPSTI